MKKGTKVSWQLKDGTIGDGITIADEDDGKIQVAVHEVGGSEYEMHLVLWCNTTWLTPMVEAPPVEAAPETGAATDAASQAAPAAEDAPVEAADATAN